MNNSFMKSITCVYLITMLSLVWQLPQSLLGMLLARVTGAVKAEHEGITVYVHHVRWLSSCSLGRYILLRYGSATRTVMHELGHSRQSELLGPMYLLVIGVPSVIGNLLRRLVKFDYYALPWERWADKLGGVER